MAIGSMRNKLIFRTRKHCLLLVLLTVLKLSAQKRPNIILIMADDMGYSDIGCYGGEVKTPNLDMLANNGVRFSQFYNNARCCPTRASILTGLYPHQAGVGGMVGNGHGDLSQNAVTIAEVLKLNGYATYMTGKWHVSDSKSKKDMHNWPNQRGFDNFFGTITGAGSYFEPHTLTRNNKEVQLKPSDNFYYTDAISDSTVSFLNAHYKEKKNTPFFFYVAYTAPHWPLHALEKDIKKYKGTFDKGWDVLRKERLDRMKKNGVVPKNTKLSPRNANAKAWTQIENKNWELQRMMTYAAQIDNMDQGIGRIIKNLKQHDELENTLIFFLSDNGGCDEQLKGVEKWVNAKEETQTISRKKVSKGNIPGVVSGPASTYMSYGGAWANLSNTPYRKYKKSGHQGGVATPFIMHWPQEIKNKNSIKTEVTSIIDIMPTILEATQGNYPKTFNNNTIQPMEGLSLLPVCENTRLDRDEWFVEHGRNKAFRKGDWKIAWSRDKNEKKWELFNLKDDPTELNDLASKKPERLSEMKSRWYEWAKRVKVIKK